MVYLALVLTGQVIGISLQSGRILGANQKLRMDDVAAAIKEVEEQDSKVKAVKARVEQFKTMIQDREFMMSLFLNKLKVDGRKALALHKGDQISEAIKKIEEKKIL